MQGRCDALRVRERHRRRDGPDLGVALSRRFGYGRGVGRQCRVLSTCASYGFCTSRSVARYKGQTLPAASGGTIADGMYRLGYILDSSGSGVTKDDMDGYAYLLAGGQYLAVGFIILGETSAGAFTTSAGSPAQISFSPSQGCESATATALSSPPSPFAFGYVVQQDGSLVLFPKDGHEAHVLLKVDSLCGGPDTAPDTPGDSFTCHVQNCGCAEAANGPADASTCKYVSGG